MLTREQHEILENTNLPLLLLLEAEEINSDDEPTDHDQEEQEPRSDDDQPEPEQEAPSEEDIFNSEIAGTEDKFLQFVLYDKLIDLNSKINILLDNVKNDSTAEALSLLDNLKHYSQYLNVLNELIFSISTSTIYKIVGQIELELIDLLEIYNASLERKVSEE